MKILHIGDKSGIASVTSNMCTKLGHPSIVVVDNNADIWDHGEYYENTIIVNPNEDIAHAVSKMKGKFDHIVYHDRVTLAKKLDKLHIPSSYMFHGNELKEQEKLYDTVYSLESMDNVFVTNESMLDYAPQADLFRTPVDLDLFKFDDCDKISGALCFTEDRHYEKVLDITKDFELPVQIIDRVNHKITYSQMPEILNSYRCYYDIVFNIKKQNAVVPELSQTGLEALACGTNVYSNGVLFTKFPEEHSDELTCREFISVLKE